MEKRVDDETEILGRDPYGLGYRENGKPNGNAVHGHFCRFPIMIGSFILLWPCGPVN